MKKLLLTLGIVSVAMLAAASSAMAGPQDLVNCNGVPAPGVFKNVFVPPGNSCVVTSSTIVTNNVTAFAGAYLEIDGAAVGHNVRGKGAATIYLHDGASVGGDLKAADATEQLFAFDSLVSHDVIVDGVPTTFGTVNVCGMTVGHDMKVTKSGSDILIGDPATIDCAGNDVQHNLKIAQNVTDVELIVRGNGVENDLTVNKNSGPSMKFVENNNIISGTLTCMQNTLPFTASGNTYPAGQIQGGDC